MAAPPPSLCPGYKQVDEFDKNCEYEDEEEIFYVTMDMGNIEPTLVPSSSSYRLIGLDTSTPFLQLQGTVLKGRHDMLLGTELIFTDDKESHDWNKRSVVHVANTEQRLAFQEVTLIPKLPSSKGKEKASVDIAVDVNPPADERSAQIDRITGLSAPTGRLRKAGSKRKSTRRTALQEALEAQNLSSLPGTQTFQLDASRDDDMDDMYMDAE